MIKNIKSLKDKEINNSRIIVYAAPPGCCKTTTAYMLVNNNKNAKCLFISLETDPIILSKHITNNNCNISDEMVWDIDKLKKYNILIVDYIQLIKHDMLNTALDLFKILRNKYNVNVIILSQLNRAGISYRNLKNSSYIEEIADEVVILCRNNEKNIIIYRTEKDRYGQIDTDWYIAYKIKNGKLWSCLWGEYV